MPSIEKHLLAISLLMSCSSGKKETSAPAQRSNQITSDISTAAIGRPSAWFLTTIDCQSWLPNPAIESINLVYIDLKFNDTDWKRETHIEHKQQIQPLGKASSVPHGLIDFPIRCEEGNYEFEMDFRTPKGELTGIQSHFSLPCSSMQEVVSKYGFQVPHIIEFELKMTCEANSQNIRVDSFKNITVIKETHELQPVSHPE